ncbi:uncharacterized protein N7443_005679 [Penicillium atrosanguineum]|uniref:Uncharacterized protein n=1 Tax=Penicillium atrosanguineum TaxID=1132637 RepID=A0A9W9U3P0_9EURO|nr:uncharacterized protein N7443_005679 [Penicillium atrosanguineum]KAJ5300677.1 hypothetical protein N7443_005679 [Penicillium atrosanguineum]KAJ5311319.1 hypothetical protein N7476_007179 [Penicillium atrosanguineum]
MGSYKSCQARAGSGGSCSSTDTDASVHSKSTAPTVISAHTTCTIKQQDWPEFEDDGPRDSVSTYASTTRSLADPPKEPLYEVNERQETFPTDALATTPSSFAGLFPSSRRLLIRHDDATIDGNMNLRVDTVVPRRGGYQQDVTLFHLRMHDLFSRKFSLRRYCRDSGREVFHSSRKEISPPSATDPRPILRRSWSSVLASLRPISTPHAPTEPTLQHQTSSCSASSEPCEEEECKSDRKLSDSILLEFSNYAHVELKRRGPGTAKRYEFEYWSTKYQWRREFRKEGDLREVSYYLIDTRTSRTIAHLVPEILTPLEAVEEESKGGWVPPCSMWINDTSVYERMPDVADVIVATGLVSLVDDYIRRRWHGARRVPWISPARSSISKGLETARLGPRRLIGEVMQRRGSA